MFTITRQHRFPDGEFIVEISQGSLDYTNPDALVEKYSGEFEEFNDPREAVNTAIDIANSWQKDSKHNIFIAMGNTHGMTAHFDELELTDENFSLLKEQADKIYESMPKCDQCGELLGKKTFVHQFYDDEVFCREYCVEKFEEECRKLNEELNEKEECEKLNEEEECYIP